VASSRHLIVRVLPSSDAISALFSQNLRVRNLPLFIFMSEMKEGRYVAALCSLVLMVLLVVGTLAYGGICRLTSPAAATARGPLIAGVVQPVQKQNPPDLDSDPLVTPSAIVLAMIAALAVVGRAAPSRLQSSTVVRR
jgi:hypothetical protein